MTTARDLAQANKSEVGRAGGRVLLRKRQTPHRGLSRVEAAEYLGISPSKFDELRHTGQIGPAKIIGSRLLFDVLMLDDFFDALPDENHNAGEDWTPSV